MKLLRRLMKVALGIVLFFGFTMSAFVIFDRVNSSKLREFCSSIKHQSTAAEVIANASQKGFPVFPPTDMRPVVSILNHMAPFFRHECAVSIQAGHVVRTEINFAD